MPCASPALHREQEQYSPPALVPLAALQGRGHFLHTCREETSPVAKRIFYLEHGKALGQAAQSSYGCPISGSIQGQLGWDLERPSLVEDVPACGRRWNGMGFKV